MKKRDSVDLAWRLAMAVTEDLNVHCRSFAENYWVFPEEGIATPPLEVHHDAVHRKMVGAIRGRNLKALIGCIDSVWEAYHTPDAIRLIRQVRALFCKNAQFSDKKTCLPKGIASFKLAERICAITNKRLNYYHLFPERLDDALSYQMSIVQRTVEKVMGDLDVFIDSIPDRVRLTSGATEHLPRARALPHMKLRGKIRCSPGAAPLVDALYRSFGISAPPFTLTAFNRVSMVEKNWTTYRVIACESTGTMPLQLAFDSWIKERLLLCLGIDLRDQERNFQMARQASIDGFNATVDMRMASDLTSLGVVAVSASRRWFSFLLRLRASHYSLKEYDNSVTRGRYAKFSSMGNGCTFGLETLLFAAACVAVGSKTYSVYGDDIVIERDLVPALLRLLRHMGFRHNESKTFCEEGPGFRESCGGDFLRGVDVTPFYLRKQVSRASEFCLLVNGLAATTPVDGNTWALLRDLYRKHGGLIGARTDDPAGNIWVDTTTAYRRGLLRYTKYRKDGNFFLSGITTQRQYVVVERCQKSVGSRSRWLWYLEAKRGAGDDVYPDLGLLSRTRCHKLLLQRCDADDFPRSPRVTSDVSIGHQQHKERRLAWIPPCTTAPGHLHRWSDYLLA